MRDDYYSYCCSKDGHGLKYDGFSIVLMQIFSIDHARSFTLPLYPEEGIPFVVEKNRSIDRLIFNMSQEDMKSIRRFDVEGFDFELSLDEPYEVKLGGSVQIEMSLLFGQTISLSYRFVFDGTACHHDADVSTDHLIALLSTHLSAEHWSKNEGHEETDINLEINGLVIDKMRLSGEGDLLGSPAGREHVSGEGRIFDKISLRYKDYVLKHCTAYKCGITAEEKRHFKKRSQKRAEERMGGYNMDMHYAMVDIWESIEHPLEDGSDLFDNNRADRLSEAEIVSHIRDFHKPEMIGLMTLYPGEWPYRDAEAYDECCGKNIAIDTDDLVLVNNNICVVIGTYGRRGKDSPVDWEEHLQERSTYHVSWPEYLSILEMVLAKKYVVGYANEQLIDATLDVENDTSTEIIANNAELSMRLSRMELQLDVVKYSKFMSHKVMFDRTTERLGLDKDMERLNSMMNVVDNSLHNLKDYKSMRSDFVLNFVLALISVASTFELFFQNTEMPFLSYFGIEDNRFAAVLVMVVAGVTFFGILLVVVNVVRSIFSKINSLR